MNKKSSDDKLILDDGGDLYAAEPDAEEGGVPPVGFPTDEPPALGEDEEEEAF